MELASSPALNAPLGDDTPHPHMAARRLRLGEFAYRHIVGFVLLERRNSYPGHYGENDADADNELPFQELIMHRCTA
jgi:hypothetical protein